MKTKLLDQGLTHNTIIWEKIGENKRELICF